MSAIDAGCQMLGEGWASHETATFQRSHPEFPAPSEMGASSIWLPHLPGAILSTIAGPELAEASLLAFAELGRFHRLTGRSLHGDPHAGNFLYDRAGGRCRIIDFETDAPVAMNAAKARAQDFLILLLDLGRRDRRVSVDLQACWEAYGGVAAECPALALLAAPGFRQRFYWRLLGYRMP